MKPDGGMNMPYNAVAVPADGAPHLILAARPDRRRRVILVNNGDSGSTCFIGSDAGVLTTTGFPLSSATDILNLGGDKIGVLPAYVLVLHTQDSIYGIVDGGGVAADIRYLEEND